MRHASFQPGPLAGLGLLKHRDDPEAATEERTWGLAACADLVEQRGRIVGLDDTPHSARYRLGLAFDGVAQFTRAQERRGCLVALPFLVGDGGFGQGSSSRPFPSDKTLGELGRFLHPEPDFALQSEFESEFVALEASDDVRERGHHLFAIRVDDRAVEGTDQALNGGAADDADRDSTVTTRSRLLSDGIAGWLGGGVSISHTSGLGPREAGWGLRSRGTR